MPARQQDLFADLISTPGLRRDARPTSIEAARIVAKTAKPLRDRVVAAFERAGSAGLTADECAARIRASILSVRPRVTELVKAGRLEETRQRRKNASNASATVWRLRPAQPLRGTV
jgi:hypothetical protein